MSVENTQNSRPLSFTERAFDRKNLVAGAIGTAAAAAVIASAVAIKSYVGAEPSIFKIPTSFSDVQSSVTGFPSWVYANLDGIQGATIGGALGNLLMKSQGRIAYAQATNKYGNELTYQPTLVTKLISYSILAASTYMGSTVGAALLKTARSI